MTKPNCQTTASEGMYPSTKSRTMNSTKNVMNLSNINDHSFDFASNRGILSGKQRGSQYNMMATKNRKNQLNKHASNASPKFSSNFNEGYDTDG